MPHDDHKLFKVDHVIRFRLRLEARIDQVPGQAFPRDFIEQEETVNVDPAAGFRRPGLDPHHVVLAKRVEQSVDVTATTAVHPEFGSNQRGKQRLAHEVLVGHEVR
jgi:hypothetical protein